LKLWCWCTNCWGKGVACMLSEVVTHSPRVNCPCLEDDVRCVMGSTDMFEKNEWGNVEAPLLSPSWRGENWSPKELESCLKPHCQGHIGPRDQPVSLGSILEGEETRTGGQRWRLAGLPSYGRCL
jgi:hypothetical protein